MHLVPRDLKSPVFIDKGLIFDWRDGTSEVFVVGTFVSNFCQQQTSCKQQTSVTIYVRLKLGKNSFKADSYLHFRIGMAWAGPLFESDSNRRRRVQTEAIIQVISWAIVEVGPGHLGQIWQTPGNH